MADPQVKIIMSLVDNVSAKMKGITGTSGKLGTAFKDLTGFSLSAASGLALVGVGLQKTVKFAKESIADWVLYNQMIREMGQVTGLGAEEISRIVQVGDDWLISSDAIRTSLAFMNKKGITPSIENLADLADEYVNTSNKSEFAEKAVTILGRGYQTLIPLLALGGDGLRDATKAVDDNLIATQKSIDATRKYEEMMDTFQDTAKGVGNTLATELIPPLTQMGNSFNNMITDNQRVNMVMDTYKTLIKAGILTQKSFNDALRLEGVTADGTEKGFAKLEETVMAYLKMIADLDAIHALDKGERDLTDTTGNLAWTYNQELAPALSDAREDMGAMTDNEIAAQIVGLQGLKEGYRGIRVRVSKFDH